MLLMVLVVFRALARMVPIICMAFWAAPSTSWIVAASDCTRCTSLAGMEDRSSGV